MRNSFKIFLLAFLVGSVGLVGCKEKPITTPSDLEAPVIIMSSPEVKPLGEFNVMRSQDTFDIDIRFEDDMELAEYVITVRYAMDLYFLRTTTDAWSETWFGDLEGTVDGVNFTAQIPYDPNAGPYIMTVTVTDADGKSTTQETYLFVRNLADLAPPSITFSNPNPALIDTFSIGDMIPVQANCNENGGLIADVWLRVRDAFTNEIMDGSEYKWDTVFVNPYLVDTTVAIPAGTVPGTYVVDVFASDFTLNIGKGSDTIYIKPN